jgi:AcrR family transcriptional regulator
MVIPRRSRIRRKLRESVNDAILDAAEEVASEAGLGGMTITEVADRAGVAVGTLYNYFPDGDAILSALFRARRRTLAPLIASAFAATKGQPFEQRLHGFVGGLVRIFHEHERFVRIAALADRDGGKSTPRDRSLMLLTVGALEQIMRDGARRKLFTPARVPIYARLLHGSIRAMFVWKLGAKDASIARDGELVVDTFLRGILG